MLTLNTGTGYWNAVCWIVFFLLLSLIVFLIRALGRKDYKKGTDQTKVFFSGNEVPEVSAQHVRADNIYWGYKKALERYYKAINAIHTGFAPDYVMWYVICTALMLIVIVVR